MRGAFERSLSEGARGFGACANGGMDQHRSDLPRKGTEVTKQKSSGEAKLSGIATTNHANHTNGSAATRRLGGACGPYKQVSDFRFKGPGVKGPHAALKLRIAAGFGSLATSAT